MAPIRELGNSLEKLVLNNSGQPISESATIVILNPGILAIVPFKDRDRESIYYAIIRTGLRPDDITIGRTAITVTI